MIPKFTLRQALNDPLLLGHALPGVSWATWRAVLLAAMGEPLTPDELLLFRRVTGRDTAPTERVDELLALVGRRGGKSRAIAVLAVYIAALCHHPKLVAGERGVLLAIAPGQSQAAVVLGYCLGLLEDSPVLRQSIRRSVDGVIELDGNIAIEVRAANFRRLRGPTCIAVIGDEAAFWFDESSGSSNADSAILAAVRPALATTGGPLIIISSPYARRGETWEIYKRHFGTNGDPRILVAQGASRDFNPELPQSVVDRAMERDPASASAEYLGQFRADIEAFVSREAVEAAVEMGCFERGPVSRIRYFAFVDPSGGASDSMSLAIAHKEGDVAILDAVREVKPPFSPEAVVTDFCALLKSYRISRVTGDRYAGEWAREPFRKHGINYEASARPKSDIYRDMLAALNSRRAILLDNGRLITQLISLERRTARGGRDSIDHPPGGHDDLANAVCGALIEIVQPKRGARLYGGPLDWWRPKEVPKQRVEYREAKDGTRIPIVISY